MHAVGESGGNDKPGAPGALCAEGVRLVDDERGTVALADLDQVGERGHVPVGAVEGIDADESGAALGERFVKRLRVVVTEGDGPRAGADDAFVQRDVRLHVEIDGAAPRGERLDQPDVGGVTRRAEDAVLGAHQGRDALLEVAGDVAFVVHPDAGDSVAMAAGTQRRDLALDDVWVAGKTKIVVAADFYVSRARGAPLEGMATLPEFDFAPDVIVVETRAEKCRLIRAGGWN